MVTTADSALITSISKYRGPGSRFCSGSGIAAARRYGRCNQLPAVRRQVPFHTACRCECAVVMPDGAQHVAGYGVTQSSAAKRS